MIRIMARKNYSDEFRRQAVDLYESTPDATLKGIAADLGVSRGTLADWVRAFGTGSTAAPPEHSSSGAKSAGTESAAVRIARLEAENARLRADKVWAAGWNPDRLIFMFQAALLVSYQSCSASFGVRY